MPNNRDGRLTGGGGKDDGFRASVGLASGFVALFVGAEFAQQMTGYRSFQVADMMANVVGVAVGWLAAPPRLPDALRLIEARWPRVR